MPHIGSSTKPHAGPWHASDCDAYYFLLNADASTIKSAVDQGLNQGLGSIRFVPAVSAVAMTFQKFNQMNVMGDTSVPTLVYPEASFFLLVSDTANANKTYVWAPYMFCSDAIATLSGREVFGFPKENSAIKITDTSFSVRTAGAKRTNNAKPIPLDLAIVEGGLTPSMFELNSNAHLKQIDLAALRHERNQEWSSGFSTLLALQGELLSWIDLLIHPVMNFIFNKNFYDPSVEQWVPLRLQARSPIEQVKFERFMAPARFMISDEYSHPLVSQLGLVLDAGQLQPAFGCKMKLNFELHPPKLL